MNPRLTPSILSDFRIFASMKKLFISIIASILAHGSPRGAYKAAAGLLKLNGLLVHDIIVERTERQFVGASFYVMNNFFRSLSEIEE